MLVHADFPLTISRQINFSELPSAAGLAVAPAAASNCSALKLSQHYESFSLAKYPGPRDSLDDEALNHPLLINETQSRMQYFFFFFFLNQILKQNYAFLSLQAKAKLMIISLFFSPPPNFWLVMHC